MKSTSSFLTGLLAGAAIGGVLALLYAPQSGKETRDQIKQKLNDLDKELENLKNMSGEKNNDIKESLINRLVELQREIESLK